MSQTKPAILLEDDGETILIESLEVRDRNGYAFLEAQDEEDRLDLAQRAVKLGLFAISRLTVGGEVDYVDKEFTRLLTELDLRLDPDNRRSHLGRLQAMIEDYFEEGGTLETLFSPGNDRGPLGQLQSAIREEIRDLRDLVVREKAKAEVWERTTMKGVDFEDACEELLNEIVSEWLGDELKRTSREEGKIDGNLTGDFVVTLRDSKDRIAIEVKDWRTLSLPAVLEELDEALVSGNRLDRGRFPIRRERRDSRFLGCATP